MAHSFGSVPLFFAYVGNFFLKIAPAILEKSLTPVYYQLMRKTLLAVVTASAVAFGAVSPAIAEDTTTETKAFEFGEADSDHSMETHGSGSSEETFRHNFTWDDKNKVIEDIVYNEEGDVVCSTLTPSAN